MVVPGEGSGGEGGGVVVERGVEGRGGEWRGGEGREWWREEGKDVKHGGGGAAPVSRRR